MPSLASQAASKRRSRIGPFGNGVGPVSILANVQYKSILGPLAAAQQNVQQILHALLSNSTVNRGQAEAGTIVISACGFQGRVSRMSYVEDMGRIKKKRCICTIGSGL